MVRDTGSATLLLYADMFAWPQRHEIKRLFFFSRHMPSDHLVFEDWIFAVALVSPCDIQSLCPAGFTLWLPEAQQYVCLLSAFYPKAPKVRTYDTYS